LQRFLPSRALTFIGIVSSFAFCSGLVPMDADAEGETGDATDGTGIGADAKMEGQRQLSRLSVLTRMRYWGVDAFAV
jgi:hypothetical protein